VVVFAAVVPAFVVTAYATTMDESDEGDVAPSYWDADPGRVVLGAAAAIWLAGFRRTVHRGLLASRGPLQAAGPLQGSPPAE